MLCAALVPLGYHGARIAWFVIGADLILLSGYLMRNLIPGVPRTIPLFGVPVFVYSIVAVVLGQTSPLIFFLLIVAWRLLDANHDGAAGSVLAWLTIKPQLTALVVLAVLLWAARRRRWSVAVGFAAMLAALGLASSLLIPGWLPQMLTAPRVTPNPAELFPTIGTTWFLLLRSAGLRSWAFWGLYLLIAVPIVLAAVMAGVNRGRPLHDVLALGILAACVVAPYGRHYDFPLLLVPLFVLLGTRLSDVAGATSLVAILLVPYLQYIVMVRLGLVGQIGRPSPEFLFAWIPLLLTWLWLATALQRSQWTMRAAQKP
jgi:hypothetical protein